MTASFKVSYEKLTKMTKMAKIKKKGQKCKIQMMLPFQENKSYQIVQIIFRQIILKNAQIGQTCF